MNFNFAERVNEAVANLLLTQPHNAGDEIVVVLPAPGSCKPPENGINLDNIKIEDNGETKIFDNDGNLLVDVSETGMKIVRVIGNVLE